MKLMKARPLTTGAQINSILADYTLPAAVTTLRNAGFRTFVLEKGTVCAYRGKACYGFQPRRGRFGKEAIQRAIADMGAA